MMGGALLASVCGLLGPRALPVLRAPSAATPRHAMVGNVATAPPEGSTPIAYADLTVGVIQETKKLEKRVAQSPDSVAILTKAGFRVVVQKDAGAAAQFSDDQYEAAGAAVVSSAEAWKADIVIKINPPTSAEARLLGDRTLISQINPSKNEALLAQFEKQGATVFALDCIPRMLSRGQAFDVLSSQTNIAGYRAVIEASNAFGRFFAGQMTAAGKVQPAKVLVLGCGVAGLAAVQVRSRPWSPALRCALPRDLPRSARDVPRRWAKGRGRGRPPAPRVRASRESSAARAENLSPSA